MPYRRIDRLDGKAFRISEDISVLFVKHFRRERIKTLWLNPLFIIGIFKKQSVSAGFVAYDYFCHVWRYGIAAPVRYIEARSSFSLIFRDNFVFRLRTYQLKINIVLISNINDMLRIVRKTPVNGRSRSPEKFFVYFFFREEENFSGDIGCVHIKYG